MENSETLIKKIHSIAREASKEKGCEYVRIVLCCGFYKLYSVGYINGEVYDGKYNINVNLVGDFPNDFFQGEIITDEKILKELTHRLSDKNKREDGEVYLDVLGVYRNAWNKDKWVPASRFIDIATIRISKKGYDFLKAIKEKSGSPH